MIRPVQLNDRIVFLGTERGVEPPLSVIDQEFWTAWLALSQTLTALREALKECRGGPSEKAKPPKGAGVALSTT